MKFIKVFFVNFIKYASPLVLIMELLLFGFGAMRPWPVAEKELSKYSRDVTLLTGIEHSYRNHIERHSNTYLIIEFTPLSSSTVFISDGSDGFREVKVESGGLFLLASHLLVLLLLTWWFWIKSRGGKREVIQ